MDSNDRPLDVDEVVFRQILSYTPSISGCVALHASFMPTFGSERSHRILDLFGERGVVIPFENERLTKRHAGATRPRHPPRAV